MKNLAIQFKAQELKSNEVITVDTYNRLHKCIKLNNGFFRVVETLTAELGVTTLLSDNVYDLTEMKPL